MIELQLLIKPVSSACNLNCRYCFYKDEAAKRAGMYVIAKRENRFHVDQRQADHIADDLLQAWLHIQEHFRLLRF